MADAPPPDGKPAGAALVLASAAPSVPVGAPPSGHASAPPSAGTRDVVLLGPPTADGTGIHVLRARNQRIETGDGLSQCYVRAERGDRAMRPAHLPRGVAEERAARADGHQDSGRHHP